MSSEGWYRNETWSQGIEDAFFKKLSRSRSQKSQYLKIQAGYLVDSNPEVVIKLSQYLREHCPDEFWEQEICLYESKAWYNLGDIELAVGKADESLAWRSKKPNTKTHIPYWYSELVLNVNYESHYSNCLNALKQYHDETPFPATQFYYYGYSALLQNRLNNFSSAKSLANEALRWANMDENLLQNSRKRKLGVLGKKDKWPISDLKEIAGG